MAFSYMLLQPETSRKIDEVNNKFNQFVNKYIGDGVGAMIIVLILIVVAIIAVRKFAKK